MNIKNKLDYELKKITYEKKKNKNLLLTENDIRLVFSLLKKNDQEVNPLLTIIESTFLNTELNEKNYIFIEESIKEILKYYKLMENKDLINCRHKFFFTESKLIKKAFFGPNKTQDIIAELKINDIFDKLKD